MSVEIGIELVKLPYRHIILIRGRWSVTRRAANTGWATSATGVFAVDIFFLTPLASCARDRLVALNNFKRQ